MNAKIFKKVLSLLLAAMFILPLSVSAASGIQKATSEYDYTIANPYKDVDWNTWKQYKANLHTHTTISDGNNNLDEMVELHYAKDYDFLAITDHGVLGTAWDTVPTYIPVTRLAQLDRNGLKPVSPLKTQRFNEIQSGAGRANGQGLLCVPNAIELNAAVPKNNHINGFFTTYGNGKLGTMGDYRTPISMVDADGGLTVINHPGEYTGARYDKTVYDTDKYPMLFSDLMLKYDSCLGLDVNSKGDNRTQNDRILWDKCLELLAPYGRNVLGFATSDAHATNVVDCAFTMMLMPSQSLANLRTSMETGAFFAVSRTAYMELGESFRGEGNVPTITKVTVNQAANTISLTGSYDKVTWVANGKEIATGSSIDLNDYQNALGGYVRAYATNCGGIIYSQPFLLSCPEVKLEKREIKVGLRWADVGRFIVDFLYNIFKDNFIYIGLRKLVLGS